MSLLIWTSKLILQIHDELIIDASPDEEEVIKTSTDDTKNITSKPNKTGNSINIIEIFMILLNIILAVLVVVLFNKNKRLRESINKIS